MQHISINFEALFRPQEILCNDTNVRLYVWYLWIIKLLSEVSKYFAVTSLNFFMLFYINQFKVSKYSVLTFTTLQICKPRISPKLKIRKKKNSPNFYSKMVEKVVGLLYEWSQKGVWFLPKKDTKPSSCMQGSRITIESNLSTFI